MNLDPGFTTGLTDMTTQSKRIADELRGNTDSGGYIARHWMIPSRSGTFNPTDIFNLSTAFKRTDLNKEYESQLTSKRSSTTEGMMGNIIVDGLQIAYMSMWERSFRERHKTDVRMQMHLAGRRTTHGDPTAGVHNGCVKKYVQSFLDNTIKP